MAQIAWIGRILDGQRGFLLPWVPVCLGVGIAIYFGLGVEPGRIWITAGWCAGAILVIVSRRVGPSLVPFVTALALCVTGFALAGTRAHQVAAPVLEFRYYGPIEGRIVEIDRSISDKIRLTLDRAVLARMAPNETPSKLRVSLHGPVDPIEYEPGLRVILTGHLSPPPRPSEPGGFDFRRLAWFEGLGAVGYTRNPVLALERPADIDAGLQLYRLRMAIADHVQDHLEGQTGAFAAAVTTGDRSGLSRETLDVMRDTNLAHLLAISGLHVGLLTAAIFAAVRFGLALVPVVALRRNTKKIGAAFALAAAAIYLALSGAPVSTQRAFIMVAVMLCAVMLDHRALTLRAVAMAATIVLVLQPEALFGAGFQMSFAATTALVWVFSGLKDDRILRLPRWARPVAALVLSSAVAGLATAPLGAAHFNRSASFGLIANLLSVPAMGSIVVPAAVAALCLAPFGIEGWAIAGMGWGIDWILAVARWFASLDGAVRHVPRPPASVVATIMLSGLFVILWQGRMRWVGFAPVCAALAAWGLAERPDILIAESGGLIGVMTSDGRALSKPDGDGFTALSWLENDGDGADQSAASERTISDTRTPVRQYMAAPMRKLETCGEAVLIVTTLKDVQKLNCTVLTPQDLALTGAISIVLGTEGSRLRTVEQFGGKRLWTSGDVRRWHIADGPMPSEDDKEQAVRDIIEQALARWAMREKPEDQ